MIVGNNVPLDGQVTQQKQKRDNRENVISLIQNLFSKVFDKLEIVIKNQQYIKADTTQIGKMLQEFYRQQPVQNTKVNNYRGQFVIKNMTDAQAKDMMVRQGVSPQIVAQLSDNKFTVQYLVSLVQK